MSKRPTCATCRHFFQHDRKSADDWQGECRFSAPNFLIDEDAAISPLWPPVDLDHWCGDWTPEDES